MINTAQLQEWLICICINRGKNNNSITYRDILHTKEHMQIAWKECSRPSLWFSWARMEFSSFQEGRKPVRRCSYSYYSSCPTPWLPGRHLDNGNSKSFLCYFLFTSLQLHVVASLHMSPSMRTANPLPCLPHAHIYPVLSPHHLCCFHLALYFSATRFLLS